MPAGVRTERNFYANCSWRADGQTGAADVAPFRINAYGGGIAVFCIGLKYGAAPANGGTDAAFDFPGKQAGLVLNDGKADFAFILFLNGQAGDGTRGAGFAATGAIIATVTGLKPHHR